MYYTKTFDEYDELLTKNIIFIDFFDTAANTAIVECIIRGTPIIVNKIGGVVEYLGENYPLYFDTLDNVPSLLNVDKIKEAHEYLVNLNKEELSIDFFLKKINTIIILLSSALHIFSHELGHLSGFRDSGEFKPEPFAESEAERAMQSFKVSKKIDAGLELKKLASKLDDLGETSFVKDVYLIASMLPREEVTPELPKKIAKRDLDLLQKDLEKLFSK
jgi:hypothetical protein